MRMGRKSMGLALSLAAAMTVAPMASALEIGLLSENFDGLVGDFVPPVDEPAPGGNVWTNVPPAGWSVSVTEPPPGVPEVGNPVEGVAEWEGWSFASYTWWTIVAGDQDRSQFALADGVIAIADPDEWDDLGDPEAFGTYNTTLSIDDLDVTGVDSGTLELSFDSSWRPEDFQKARIEISIDNGPDIEVLRWTSDVNDPNFKTDAVSERVTIALPNGGGITELDVKFIMFDAGNDWWWALDDVSVDGEVGGVPTNFLTEGFEGVILGAPIDEAPLPPNTWTPNPPAGWTVDNTGVAGIGDPLEGVEEWEGWSFPSGAWWAEVAEDQGRLDFVDAFELGDVVAVADPDEWDDLGDPESIMLFNSYLITPTIQLQAAAPLTAQLEFASSWRPEDTQTAVIEVSYDNGPWTEVLRWESVAGPNFKADATNEVVQLPLQNPEGATSFQVRFGMLDAGNDWWWAIDDVNITAEVNPDAITVWEENFDSVALGICLDEECGQFREVWTDVPPSGWTREDPSVPGIGDPAEGVEEWEGWSFADKAFWSSVDDQGRTTFDLGQGIVAVADPDEWDDLGDPDGIALMDTSILTPAIDVTGVDANSLELTFDSSWRDEDLQKAQITVSYDAGPEQEVLLWVSDSNDPNFKDDNTNETVTIPLNNPGGNGSAIIRFRLFDGGNDWWWAIDNISVDGEIAAVPTNLFTEDFEGVGPLLDPVDDPVLKPLEDVWTDVPPAGWAREDTSVPGIGDPLVGVEEWEGWSFALISFWDDVAGQSRGSFVDGDGVAAIADGDEWDDLGDPESIALMDTSIFTPTIDITGADQDTLELTFASSWRSEDFQSAEITVSYDAGPEQQVLLWDSSVANAQDPGFKADAISEVVTIPLNNPAGANTATLRFRYFEAGNDWWWAIDNVSVDGDIAAVPTNFLMEDFEGVVLTPSTNEIFSSDEVWSETPPAGWVVDDTMVPGAGDDATDGVTEWAGWAFTDPTWWVAVAGDQDRSQFTKGQNVVAVADPDEWDDNEHTEGVYDAFLTTPEISVTGVQQRTLFFLFDSSWRFEDFQQATVRVSFDGGPPEDLILWDSLPIPVDPGFVFKPDATNETVLLRLDNPVADTVQFTFGMETAGNDWWWAIDNLALLSILPTTDPVFDYDNDGDVDGTDHAFFQLCSGPLTPASLNACLLSDVNTDSVIDAVDADAFKACSSGAFVPADPACDNPAP